MTYFNPKIYNFSNLVSKDKEIVLSMLWSLEVLESIEFEYPLEDNSSTLEKIRSEIARDVLAEAEERIAAEVVHMMVSMIDGYDHDAEEIDTTDYFFGTSEYLSYNAESKEKTL